MKKIIFVYFLAKIHELFIQNNLKKEKRNDKLQISIKFIKEQLLKIKNIMKIIHISIQHYINDHKLFYRNL